MQRLMSIEEVLHEVVLRSDRMSVKEQAEALGISEKNYYNMINPSLHHFKFPLVKLVPLMQLLQDYRVLDYLASRCDRVALPVPKVPEGMNDVQLEMNRTIKELGDVLQKLGEAMSPEGEKGAGISVNEARGIEGEINELVPQVLALLRAVQNAAQG